jgi:1-acyl-sn-glycerol-3-phosphate acyltransferase
VAEFDPKRVLRSKSGQSGPGLSLVPPTGEPTGSGGLALSDVDLWGRSEQTRRLARRMFDPLYRHWFRAEWEGLEHIPRSGPALLVANHAGALPPDAPVIMHGIETEMGRPVYGLADYMFRALPLVGTMWSRAGGVTAHPDNAHRLLHDEQQLVLVFPEGTKGPSKPYSERYRLRRFGRGGFVETAMRAGAPIVPIAVVGAEEAMPVLAQSDLVAKLLRLPYAPLTVGWLPAKFRLRVLSPIRFDVEPDLDRYPRSRVMAEADAIRTSIQDALLDMLAQRHSVWFG